LVETPSGVHLVKLRGAGQGTGALVAEIVCSRIAAALLLPVLPMRLALLEPDTPTDDREDELADLLTASVGWNLAVPYLESARDATAADFGLLTLQQQAAVLWLDRLTLNPDRTAENPNLLWHKKRLFLIDHGAALRFQYQWPGVREDSPRDVGRATAPHIFDERAGDSDWAAWDELFASCLTRDVLEHAVAAVPDTFLEPLMSTANPSPDSINRRRAAYVAYLWKRLKAPRAFASEPPSYEPQVPRGVPEWLRRRR
jgi:hypothetical protein